MMLVSSPAVSSRRWDSWNYGSILSCLKIHQPLRFLPAKKNDMRPAERRRSMRTVALAAATVRPGKERMTHAAEEVLELMPSAARKQQLVLSYFQAWEFCVDLEQIVNIWVVENENEHMDKTSMSQKLSRWTLDDVERISRGLPSKAKMGSRAVPHRLNAEERKAFQLAKKRGYVVQQANSRRYPLINTYRNYCDALGFLCIRIEQGTTGFSDQVVLDFTPLHWTEVEVSTLRAEISKAVMSVLALDNDRTATFGEGPKVDAEGVGTKDVDNACPHHTPEESHLPESSTESGKETLLENGLGYGSEPLKFQASSRSVTKVISQTALDVWRRFSTSKARN